jgi:hypothetical protein
MTTYSRKAPEHWIVRFLPLQTLTDAQNLAHRFREVEGFRRHVLERRAMVMAGLLVMVLIAIAGAVGVVVFLADHHALLALLGILLLPVALVGSFLVQTYVFFSWVEGRALSRELGNRHRTAPSAAAVWLSREFALDMGPFPPVPWLLAAILVFSPLALLAASWPSAGLVVILLGIVMPVVYAKFGG